MQKRLVVAPGPGSVAEESWLNLEAMAQVELTSEDPACPIEGALLPNGLPGWRAAAPGTQSIRLLFHQPFVLRWSPDGGRSSQDLVRQQYTFSPEGSTSEVEDLNVDLRSVTALELTIIPDQGREQAHACLAEWRLA